MEQRHPRLNAKLQQLAERITWLEELVMGAVVDASDPENSPAPSPEAPPSGPPWHLTRFQLPA